MKSIAVSLNVEIVNGWVDNTSEVTSGYGLMTASNYMVMYSLENSLRVYYWKLETSMRFANGVQTEFELIVISKRPAVI